MNDSLDAWLDSLGINTSPEPQQSSQNLIEDATRPAVEEVEPQPELVPISNLDLEEILSDNGLAAPISEPEEVHDGIGRDEILDADFEESGEEEEEDINDGSLDANGELIDPTANDSWSGYHENIGESRDLDAEEDADWEEAIASRQAVPVMVADRQRIATEAPVTPEEAMAYPQREPLLAPNSPTLLMDDTTSRFSGMEWFNEIQMKTIIIAGIGGIGSWLSFQIARMNPNALFMYDNDIVEMANMSGQLYGRSDAGKPKVTAMQDMITKYTTSRNIYSFQSRFDETKEPADIMMCGFDNMAARRTFYMSWFSNVLKKPEGDRKNCLFLDGRLSVNTLQVYCITGDDVYNQEKYVTECLFDDSEAEETVCSMKQTTYLACMIGSLMVNLFTNFCADLLDPIIPYDLPFFTEYDAQNMIFKTEN